MTDYFNSATPEIINDPDEEKYVQQLNQQAVIEQQEDSLQKAKQQQQQAQAAADAEKEKQEEESNSLGGRAKEAAIIAATPVLGVGDFVSDFARLFPGGKGLDDWWDENSPRSKHGLVNGLRDIAGVVLPSVVPAGWAVRGANLATKGMQLAKWQRMAGTIAANVGIDTGVAAISETSEQGENLGTLMNKTFGWDVPWAIRDGDSPDVRRAKNILEAASITGGVELLLAKFANKGTKLIPKDEVATEVLAREEAAKVVDDFPEPTTDGIEQYRNRRQLLQDEEMVRALEADPQGFNGYNAWINEPAEPQTRAVINVDANGLQAKADQAIIQGNLGTTNGRMTAVATPSFQKKFMEAADGTQRADNLNELFSTIAPSVDVIRGSTKIPADKVNAAVDTLVKSVFNVDPADFTKTVESMKKNLYEGQDFFGEEEWLVASNAFKQSFDEIFDPNKMRASAMLTQTAADNVADTSRATMLIGDIVDTTRQQEMALENMRLLASEIRANQYIAGKSLEMKKLVKNGTPEEKIAWMAQQKQGFEEGLKAAKEKGSRIVDTLQEIRKENPEYLKPLISAYDATNGKVDDLYKLQRYAEENIGLIKKGFIDGNPAIPSQVIQGLQAVRYNHVLSGISAIRAGTGNVVTTLAKPISAFAGALVTDPTGKKGVLKRALYTYSGVSENLKRALKVMGDEWKFAVSNPEEAMTRGRGDLMQAKLDNYEVMEGMAEAWSQNGQHGKVAMWNLAKGLGWYNNNPFVKYGTNAMYALDGFLKSMMASGISRAKAYDEVFKTTNGAFDDAMFAAKQKELYSKAFDSTGMLTDEAAKHASGELALNLDNEIVQRLEHLMEKVPFMRSLFMFPRTGVNALEFGWSFNPVSGLGLSIGRVRKVMNAKTQEEITEALAEHGMEYSDEAFHSLKAEYVGRQLMGTTVVLAAGMWAAEGNLTGNGPQDAAEKKRMMGMNWKPLSIKGPDGEWHSYQGFEPFDTLLGLVGDWAFQANRVDQAWSEDFGRKILYSISMNVANKTFLSGFEPLVSMLSGDEGAWNRFMAMQADSMIPYTGVRSLLSKAITPQLKDVENDFGSYLANRNKFLFSENDVLKDMLDIYTGRPINYQEPLTAAANAMLPFFKSNGGLEPWRQWLLGTGWDNLQTVRTDPTTKEPLTPDQRQYVNNWIAQNAGLADKIEQMRSAPDKFWDQKIKEYVKERGLQKQSELPIKKMVVHEELDRIHNEAFNMAFTAYEQQNAINSMVGGYKARRDRRLGIGDIQGASSDATQVQELLQIAK
jgi:hypothetical protein